MLFSWGEAGTQAGHREGVFLSRAVCPETCMAGRVILVNSLAGLCCLYRQVGWVPVLWHWEQCWVHDSCAARLGVGHGLNLLCFHFHEVLLCLSGVIFPCLMKFKRMPAS